MSPSPRGRISRLLKADADNVSVAADLIRDLHPWAYDAFDETDRMFDRIIAVLGNWTAERDLDGQLDGMATTAGISPDALMAHIRASQVDDIPGAAAVFQRLWTFRIIKIVVLACQRYWAWGSADLFRLRVGSAIGYLRLEAEAVGLIELFLADDDLAARWAAAVSEEEGKRFYYQTQKRLVRVLKARNLETPYNMASRTALHVRLTGVAHAIDAAADGRLALPDQDINPEEPFGYHNRVAYFHRIQARVLNALGELLPGVNNDDWRGAMRSFVNGSDEMWAELERRYAGEIEINDRHANREGAANN